VWDEPVALGSTVRAGPALLGESLLVGTESGALYLLDPQEGTKTEFYTVEGSVFSTPAVVDNMVYVGTALGNVYALDADRPGNPLVWRYPSEKE
jgi:outer membrane protein assembly factor BamB